MATYFVKPAFLQKNPNARTQVEGVGVSLNGSDQTIELPGDKLTPGVKKSFRAATQADLQYLYEVKGMTREIGKTEDAAKAVNKREE